MSIIDWIGIIGVFQILSAYFLQVTGMISSKSLLFILLNLFGAAMACLASVLIKYWPFIILEGMWTTVSAYAMIKYFLPVKSNKK